MDVDANIAEEDAVPTVQPTPPSRGPMITMDLDPNIAEEEAVDDYLYSNEPRMEVDNPVAASALSVPEAVPDFMDVDDAELLGDAPPMQPETRAAPALVPAPAPFVIPGLMTSEPSAGPSSAMSQGEKDAGLLSKLGKHITTS